MNQQNQTTLEWEKDDSSRLCGKLIKVATHN
jgi:hypothetical protein